MHRRLHITKCHSRPYTFSPQPTTKAYALLILICASDVTAEEQAAISRDIVASGARYVSAWGHKCSTWDDSVDFAYLESTPNFQPLDANFVMTTWHDDQPPEEVFEFLWMCGMIDDHFPEMIGVFLLGENPKAEEDIMRRAREFGAIEYNK